MPKGVVVGGGDGFGGKTVGGLVLTSI